MHLRQLDVRTWKQFQNPLTKIRINRILGSIALLAVVTVSLLPAEALAFEANLSTAVAAHLVMPVELAGRSSERASLVAGRDPYLTQAIDTLPNYGYTETGTVVAINSPVTVEGKRLIATRLAVSSAQSLVKPELGKPVVLEGEASFYSRAGCLGCDPLRIMANGQPLDDTALTMAIGADKKHLVGYRARVTSLATGKSVDVKITDTGGFYQKKYGERVADLTVATKEAIGMRGGVGQVRVEVY